MAPANVDTPLLGATDVAVQPRVPPPVMVRLTLFAQLTAVFPYRSWTVTTGWIGNTLDALALATPAVWVVKTRLAPAPAATVKLVEVPV